MDTVNTLFSHINDVLYQELKSAIELGRWQSGNFLSEKQKQIALQAIIHYESRHLPADQHTAYIYKPEHDACNSSQAFNPLEEQVIKFK